MTDLETRLRGLADLDPGPVDVERLSSGARHRATRHRRRVAGGLAVAALAVIGILASTALGRGELRADLPADRRSVQVGPSDAALCSVDPSPSGPPLRSGDPSLDFRAVALCPDDPAAPAWDELPVPAVVHGRFVDGIAITGGGPPVETCDAGRPALPAFRLVLVSLGGGVYDLDSSGMECGGALAAQSLAGMLAEEAAIPHGGCAVVRHISPADPPMRFDDVASVDVCVLVNAYAEAEPSPLRYRPMRQTTLEGADRQAVLDGLAGAAGRADRFTECPWRHAIVEVVVTTGDGSRSSALLRCTQDYSQGVTDRLAQMQGTWPVLAGDGQMVLAREVGAYLEGRPAP